MKNVKKIGRLLCMAASMHAVSAQSGAPVEGEVRNRATGAGVAGASVTFFTTASARYQATTDGSGVFRIADMEPGQYQAVLEKSGFVTFPKDPIAVERGGAPIRLQYQMQFGVTPRATLRGRMLTSTGKAAASAHVILIRGPELSFTATTDADGRFAFAQLDPGAYTLLAAPSASTGDVATYFPSSVEERGAQRIVIGGNAEVDGFQLQTAPVFRVRGVVTDNYGRVAPRATVRLMPITQQPAHVVLSFDSTFIAVGEGKGPGPEAASVVAGDDGSFEFPSVRSGQWTIAAKATPSIDPQSGFNLAQVGSAALAVTDGDVKDLRVLVADPFTLTGSAVWQIWCASGHIGCGQKPAEGAVAPIWLRSVDGQPSALHLGLVQADGAFRIEHIPAGNYVVQALPLRLNGRMMTGARTFWRLGTHGDSGEAEDLSRGDPLALTFSIVVSEGEPILYVDHPVDRTVRHIDAELSGSVHGRVADGRGGVDGRGAAVVLLPEQSDFQLVRGALVFCQPDGTFEARDLAAGSYRIAAYRGVDMEALRDPELFRQILATEKKVRVELGAATEVQLEASSWPQ